MPRQSVKAILTLHINIEPRNAHMYMQNDVTRTLFVGAAQTLIGISEDDARSLLSYYIKHSNQRAQYLSR